VRQAIAMSSIFVSYSRKDADFALQLARSLSDMGADVWIDVQDIPPGMKWSSAIQQGLDVCDALVVVISPDAMASHNVEDEWQYALDQKKPVIPLLWRPAKLHFQLSRIQYIDFQNLPYPEALSALSEELSRRSVPLGEPSSSTPKHVPKPLSARSRWLLAGAGAIALIAIVLLIAAIQPVPPAPVGTPTRTPPRVLAPAELTATEAAAIEQAETELAATDFAPTFEAQTATAEAIQETLEGMTPTNTPLRLQTLRAARTATAIAGMTATSLAPTHSPTPADTSTPSPTLTPYAGACEGAPPSRLNQGMLAEVASGPLGQGGQTLNVRRSPNGLLAALIPEGTLLYTTGQPSCDSAILWWPVQTADGLVRGWAAEGTQDGGYFLDPLLPEG
jgi:hypothetical protein